MTESNNYEPMLPNENPREARPRISKGLGLLLGTAIVFAASGLISLGAIKLYEYYSKYNPRLEVNQR